MPSLAQYMHPLALRATESLVCLLLRAHAPVSDCGRFNWLQVMAGRAHRCMAAAANRGAGG